MDKGSPSAIKKPADFDSISRDAFPEEYTPSEDAKQIEQSYHEEKFADEFERIERYCMSDIPLQRIVQVRNLASAGRRIPFLQLRRRLQAVLDRFFEDEEVEIRRILADQAFTLAKHVSKGGDNSGYGIMLEVLLPASLHLCQDAEESVREQAVTSFRSISALIRRDDIPVHVLRPVLNLAHTMEREDDRVVGSQLLGLLSPVIGKELCNQVSAKEMGSMADDPSYRVRKAAAVSIAKVMEEVEQDVVVDQLLPVYLALCQDSIWGVRKAAVESIAIVSNSLPRDLRAPELVPIVDASTKDVSRWVRTAMLQKMGEFLTSLPSTEISEDLLMEYTSLARAKPGDGDLSYYCAYSFPAVVLSVGARRWSELCDAFMALAKDIQYKVRRSLAFSLHEVARILGPEITLQDLLPVFEGFLRDLDEVRIGSTSHYAEFVGCLPEGERDSFVSILMDLQYEAESWRIRESLGQQLGTLCRHVSIDAVRSDLIPVLLDLCNDPIFQVRESVIPEVAVVYSLVREYTDIADELVAGLTGMAKEESCQKRQHYIHMCGHLAKVLSPDDFTTLFLDPLWSLVGDPIPIARISVAKCLRRHLLPHPSKQGW
uniref:Uncharacterized protein n=1 Tax=Palpitomonas bilix TaxID=652834 RepID=A0A7S3LY02_9EUKA|mmetsp:Transcript_9186/g.24892  ORF Transcript_9186/g.24892 Transcript_9186/m.24892 type:complete len:601 (+) Transcript_9186:369-2171(+)